MTKVNLQNSIANIADDQEEAIREHYRNDLKSQYEDECWLWLAKSNMQYYLIIKLFKSKDA